MAGLGAIERTELVRSAERFVENYAPASGGPRPGQGAAWPDIHAAGWLGLPISGANGGWGGSALDVGTLMSSLGRGLVVEPYLSAMLLSGRILDRAPSTARTRQVLDALISGRRIVAPAVAGFAAAPGTPPMPTVQASRITGGYSLRGHAPFVMDGGLAHGIVLACRMPDGPGRDGAIALFLVEADAPGLARERFDTIDGRAAAALSFEDVTVSTGDMVASPSETEALVEEAVDWAIIGACADAVGAMRGAMALTLDYMKTRRQFGQAIGSFQALQHRAVDMAVAIELAEAALARSAIAFSDAAPRERAMLASASKVQVGRAAKFVGQNAVQLHGAIGVTDEAAIGRHFKHLTAFSLWLGTIEDHLARYSSLSS